jgi:hypothetical protein
VLLGRPKVLSRIKLLSINDQNNAAILGVPGKENKRIKQQNIKTTKQQDISLSSFVCTNER